MTNSRKKNLIIICCLLVATLLCVVTVVFAYSVMVAYNYDVTAEADILTYTLGTSGTNQTVTISDTSNDITTTKADLIVVTGSSNLTVAGDSPLKTVEYFSEEHSNTFYKMVFEDLDVGSTLTVANGTLAVIAIAPNTATITQDASTYTLNYTNVYVTDEIDLKAVNTQAQYNDIFEFTDGYFNSVKKVKALYLLDDVTIASDLVLHYPCSINLLNSVLTLSASLTVEHSYAGSYYIQTASAYSSYGLSEGSISIANGEMLTLNTPKAYYTIATTLDLSADNYTAVFSFDTYGNTLISDALDYVESLIPEHVYQTLLLQPCYHTYGVDFTYEVVDGATPRHFDGTVSSTAGDGRIVRQSTTTAYTVRVTASRGELSSYRDLTVNVVGTNAADILVALKDEFMSAFSTVSNSDAILTQDVDLYPLLMDVYLSSNLSQAVTLSVSETVGLPITDKNAVRLVTDGTTESFSVTVSYNSSTDSLSVSNTDISSLYLRFGTVNLSDTLTFTLSTGVASEVCTLNMLLPTPDEVVYYLKAESAAFTTNESYSVLNLQDTDDDEIVDCICQGNTPHTSTTLGLTQLTNTLVFITDGVESSVTVSSYFSMTGDSMTYTLIPDPAIFPSNMYLKYTMTFADSSEKTFLLPIIRVVSSEGGSTQQFQSDNPFDELFLSSDINWLIGGQFSVPASEENYYASIEILTVDGGTYAPNVHKFCVISNSGANVTFSNKTYYKTVSFTVDTDYVPANNSRIKVRCSYFNNNAGEVTITEEYNVVIRGIFKCGDNENKNPADCTDYVFSDPNFYTMTVGLFFDLAPSYVSEVNGERILLSDSANASIALDYRLLSAPASGIDITGIERLSHITLLNLNGIAISNLSALADMSASALTELHLSGCSLDDTELYGNGAQSYLYNLNVTKIDLSSNAISRTDNLLMRTVRVLDLSNQTFNGTRVLTDISGLGNLVDLSRLDVSDNAIYRFAVLRELDSLEDVYIYGNRVFTYFDLYGVNGYVNVPYYVDIINNGVNVHANSLSSGASVFDETLSTANVLGFTTDTTSGLFSSGGAITPDMVTGSEALNALMLETKLFSSNNKQKLESDVTTLYITEDSANYTGVDGGSGSALGSIYAFRFLSINSFDATDFDRLSPTDCAAVISSTMILMDSNYSVPASVSGSVANPVTYYYIIVIMETSTTSHTILAFAEFAIDVCY